MLRASLIAIAVPGALAQGATTCADLRAASKASACCGVHDTHQIASLPTACPATTTCRKIKIAYQAAKCCDDTPSATVDLPENTCDMSKDYDVNPKVSRVPASAMVADTKDQLVMAWDRMQVEEKANLYGRLLDNFDMYCETDGYCFGDLFAANAWICHVEHTNVASPFPDYANVYPGAPALPSSGKPITGPACMADLGAEAPMKITKAYQPMYGKDGIFQSAGHQPRHTINNFVVTDQDKTSMTTQHYQIIERYFVGDTSMISYDGSGYTVQLKWTKEGMGYQGMWKITQMVEVFNGHGHLGIPPTNSLETHQGFIEGMRKVGGAASLASGSDATMPEYVAPTIPSPSATPKYENLNPKITRIPTAMLTESDKTSAMMLWDRFDVLEKISMYSWLADETRVNLPQGYAWGDMFADDSTFCIYPAATMTKEGTYEMPPFDVYKEGDTYNGRPFVPGWAACPADVPASQNCKGTCSPAQGKWSQEIMQLMITGTFGQNGAVQNHNQQTRHTLTNKLIISQTMDTIRAQYTNTLERFIGGVAYDGSGFVYDVTFVKVGGLWKFGKLAVISQGNGHLATGNPDPATWGAFMEGINNYTGTTNVKKYGRRLQAGPGESTTKGPLDPSVVAPNIQLNPMVSRIPIGALDALSKDDVKTPVMMAWDRLAITERLNMYPWLADEMRRNQPKGYLWGDLYADGAYFCEYAYYDVKKYRPMWSELGPGYDGAFGGGIGNSAPGTGAADSCAYGLGEYAQEALQTFASGFGAGGPFQNIGQQTRHTFSNYVFLNQTDTHAATLNYNIVERYQNGVALDGSNFLYHMNWMKVDGVWKNQGARVIIFGHDRLTPAPSPEAYNAWLAFIKSEAFM